MSKHTPGPWYTMAKGDEYQSQISQEGTGKTVALTYTSNDADAALIAAAPDLLAAALRMVQTRRFKGGPNRNEIESADYDLRDAIAKATGTTAAFVDGDARRQPEAA